MAKVENKIKLLQLKAIGANQANQYMNDGGGLRGRVRVGRAGNISVDFSYQFRVGDKRREKRCGTWPDKELTEIRATRNNFRQLVNKGIDPIQSEIDVQLQQAQERDTQIIIKAEIDNRLTVKQLFDRWKKYQLNKRKDGGASITRSFTKDVFPAIGDLPAEDVKRSQIADILHSILDRGSNRMANITLSDLRQLYGYAIGAGLLENDPTVRLTKASFGGNESPRDRVLSGAELKQLFHMNLPDSTLNYPYKLGIPIMLGTLARVGELLKSKKTDFDLNNSIWNIPKEHSKNGKEHVIHLSEFVMPYVERLMELSGESVWLFPNKDNTLHVCVKSMTKQIGDRQRNKEPLPNRAKDTTSLMLPNGGWTPHDLRRTGATMMGDLNIRPDVIEKCLNHVDDDKVRGTYQRQTLLPERRNAFDDLGVALKNAIAISVGTAT